MTEPNDIEQLVYDFETEFGMIFQPYGDNLDKAKQFLRDKLTTLTEQAREEEREKNDNILRRVIKMHGAILLDGKMYGLNEPKKMVIVNTGEVIDLFQPKKDQDAS